MVVDGEERILPGSSWRMSNALSCKYYFTLSFALLLAGMSKD